jgi:hypothetical protein
VLRAPPRSAAGQLLELTGQETLADELRALAIEALVRAHRGPEVAERLLAIVTRNSRWTAWGGREPRSRTSIAALSALARHWPGNREVAAVLRHAAASPSPDVRLAVSGVRS